MKKLAIFDFDGTIADTSQGIVNSVRYTQEKMKLPAITYEQMLSHVGPPMEESYARNFDLSGDRLKEAVKYHKEYAIRQGYKELTLYPGIRELLEQLKKNRVYTAVATLKPQTTVDKILKAFRLESLFDCVVGSDTENPMRKSDMICKCLEKTCCEKQDAFLVGDSQYDADAAREAGIDFVAVTYGFGFKSADEVSGTTHVCDTVREIMFFWRKEQ